MNIHEVKAIFGEPAINALPTEDKSEKLVGKLVVCALILITVAYLYNEYQIQQEKKLKL